MEFIGGQAVIEGVLIKSGNKVATAVRTPEGEITIKEDSFTSVTKKYKHLNVPFLRGSIILFETMALGIKALNFSAQVAADEGEEKSLSTFAIAVSIIVSLIFALLLFKLLPLGIAQWATLFSSAFENRFVFNLTEGIAKVVILIAYIYGISLMPDVRRVFQYHGAEHKVVNAYENKDLRNAGKYSRIHTRCGTSFILFVVFLSIPVYLFLPTDISFFAKYGLRILLLPLIAGIGYEVIRLSPKYEKKILFKMLIMPGLLLQRLTTKEPSERQIEVAKAALLAVV